MKLMPFNFEPLDEESYFISNIAGFSSFVNFKQLESIIDFGQTFNPELDRLLENKLFISAPSSVNTAIASLASALGKRVTTGLEFKPIFMIVPTLRCDHSCKYCQVSRASINASGFDLDKKLIPKIIDTIALFSTPPYKLELQGGEPLLRFDLVELIYQLAEEKLGDDSIEMVIATSLSLISDEIIDWARSRNVVFSISLDGDQLVHDKNRIHPSGNAYQLAINGIKKIQSQLGMHRLSTVTTVTDELIKNPLSLLDTHKALGLFDLFVRPVSPYGFATTRSSVNYSMQEYMQFYAQLWDGIKQYRAQGLPFVEHSVAIHIKKLFVPGFSSYADLKSPSGVVLNCVLFNYDGRVYGSDESRMLQKVNPQLDFSAGTVGEISFADSDYYKNLTSASFNFLHPGCENCAFLPFCGSDPCQNISMQGEPIGDKSLSTFCEYHKSMFKFLVNKYNTSSDDKSLIEDWIHA